MSEISINWGQQLAQLPVYLVLLVGIILALTTWRKHPRVSMLAFGGLSLVLLVSLVATFLGSSLPLFLHTRGMPARFMGTVLWVVNLVLSLLRAVGWGLILVAIFGWRRGEQSTA